MTETPPNPGSVTPPKGHKARNAGIGCLGFLVLLVVIVAATGNKGTSVPAASDNGATPTAAASHAPAAPASMAVLLDVTGSGIKKTQKFTAAADWDLEWSYDCSNFGNNGNFQVYAYDSNGLPDPLTNELGAKGSDVTHQHTGGTFYLEVNSECKWHVVVKG